MVRTEFEIWRDELAAGPRRRTVRRFLAVWAVFMVAGAAGVVMHSHHVLRVH